MRSSPTQSFAKCLCRQSYIWSLNLGQAQNLAILQLHREGPVPTRWQQPRLGLRARHSTKWFSVVAAPLLIFATYH